MVCGFTSCKFNIGLVSDVESAPELVMVVHDPVPWSHSKYMSPDSLQPPLPIFFILPAILKVPVSGILGSAVGWFITTPFMGDAAKAELTIARRNRTVKAVCLIIFSAIRITRMRRFFLKLFKHAPLKLQYGFLRLFHLKY